MFTKIQMDYRLTLMEASYHVARTAGITIIDKFKSFVSSTFIERNSKLVRNE